MEKKLSNVINPFEALQSLDKKRKRRIAFYGRVSTEHESQLDALQNQMQWYDDQLEQNKNWNLYKKYIDRGITGTQARKRPAFLQMIKDAKEGKFDLIVTREVSRFARNTVDTLEYTRLLKYTYNVEVFFVIDNIWTFDGDGELRLTIMATMAQDESRKMSERVKAGQKVSRDNTVLYGNGNILGYDRIGDKYIINTEQAETVRLIYSMYLEGYSMSSIRDTLEKEGRKTATGNTKWSTTNISRILHKKTYCGYAVYGQSYNNGYLEQKRFHNPDANSYIYKKTESIPVIINEEDFEKVQKIIASKRFNDNTGVNLKHVRGKKEVKDIWLKKLQCRCGYSMRKDHWSRKKDEYGQPVQEYAYRCYNQINNGTKKHRQQKGLDITNACDIKVTPEWKLKMMSQEVMKQLFANKELLIKKANDIIESNYIKDNLESEELRENYLNDLSKLQEKADRILDLRVEGEITKEEYNKLKQKNIQDIRNLEQKINALENNLYNIEEKNSNSLDYLSLLESLMNTESEIDKDILDEFIYKIIKLDDNTFLFIMNLGATDEQLQAYMDYLKNNDYKLDDLAKNVNAVPIMINNNTGCYCSKWGKVILRHTITTELLQKLYYEMFSSSNTKTTKSIQLYVSL